MIRGKDLITKFRDLGYDEPVYEKYKAKIALQNGRMVQTTAFIGSIIMLILTVASLFVASVSKVLPLYIFTAIVFSITYVMSLKLSGKSSTVTLICNYTFLSAAFFFAIGLDIIQKNATATTVCVLLVSLPLLIVDKPFREFLFFFLVSICFMFESKYIKQSPKASVDILNALSFLLIGSFLGYKHNQMVLRNIVGHSLLEKQRDMDTLTTLYNKSALEHKAEKFLKKEGARAGLFVMDMDNFKYVNDTFGHNVGDELLIEMSNLLQSMFRGGDMISRFGGDEFVIFLPMTDDKDILQSRAEEILREVENIRISADADYRAQVCMGIATCPEDGSNYEELFKNADLAMYNVKKHGKNGFHFFTEHVKKKILVVDDVEMNRSILEHTLRDGYEVLQAEDGMTALKVLEEVEDIAVVITDIQMPNMDGTELIKKIRNTPQYADIAIIANTQYGDMKQEEEIFALGVDDFVYKAASPRVIQMRVKNVMKTR